MPASPSPSPSPSRFLVRLRVNYGAAEDKRRPDNELEVWPKFEQHCRYYSREDDAEGRREDLGDVVEQLDDDGYDKPPAAWTATTSQTSGV